MYLGAMRSFTRTLYTNVKCCRHTGVDSQLKEQMVDTLLLSPAPGTVFGPYPPLMRPTGIGCSHADGALYGTDRTSYKFLSGYSLDSKR
eukprot:SAG31_NODE_3251_length_4490_cov_2.556821_4_plen_89_part_00